VAVLKILKDAELSREAYKIINLVKQKYEDKDYLKSVRTRCRQLYGYLFKTGVLSTISYTFAKGGEELVKTAFKWITTNSELPPKGEKEEVGYAIYAASLCMLFEKIGFPTSEGSLGRVIQAITSNPTDTLIIEEQALRFARWLKKFAEALLPEK
jgi:CRISPR type III-B/RAMP module-associated protein Cmr5